MKGVLAEEKKRQKKGITASSEERKDYKDEKCMKE